MRRWLAVMFVAFVGCGGGGMDDTGTGGTSVQPGNRLTGNWIFIGDTTSLALDFGTGAKYVLGRLGSTGSTTAIAQVETGEYTTSSTLLTLVPQQASCPGPHPAYQENYSFSAGDLVISDTTGTVSFVPNPPTSVSVALTYGCFASDGTFTASPLVAVSN